ncbi:MAG: hypothetical protein AAFR71_09855 [Pseudomonadota bacterium]
MFYIQFLPAKVFFWIICLSVHAITASGSKAAEFMTLSTNPLPPAALESSCTHVMSGKIETGDSERLQNMISELPGQDHDDENFVLCLNSVGGSLNEALSMGVVLQKNFFGTKVENGASCLSACAVLFMHGTVAYFDFLTDFRVMEVGATVGFHAPSLGLEFSESDLVPGALISQSYDAALANIGQLVTGAHGSVSENSRPTIPIALLSDMLQTPSDSFTYVDTLHKAFRWRISVLVDRSNFPTGYDEKVALYQICENSKYEIYPQASRREAHWAVTPRDVEGFEQAASITSPSPVAGFVTVSMGLIYDEQCLIKDSGNDDRFRFHVKYFIEGREQAQAYLSAAYLLDPNIRLSEL